MWSSLKLKLKLIDIFRKSEKTKISNFLIVTSQFLFYLTNVVLKSVIRRHEFIIT